MADIEQDASTPAKPIVISARNASGTDGERTLLPMLLWGLALVTAGMICLMLFV
ncbi:MAG: hypothetical protein KDJ29_20910 [Hyphomicrobiales bacterium]|nr:hypothetical protein [Hyphomicrobiales bacterium]